MNVLFQSPEGYLWVGTMNGLYRGDGLEFHAFLEKDGLPSATIQSVLREGNGRIWVATREGLAVFEDGRFTPVRTTPEAKIFGRSALTQDGEGRIYLATNRGLFRNQPGGGWNHFQLMASRELRLSPQTRVEAVYADPSDAVWVSTRDHIVKISDGRAVEYGEPEGVPLSRWDAFQQDREGNLWARSSERLVMLRRGASHFVSFDEGLPQAGYFGALAMDRQGRVLVPTDSGLAYHEGGHWQFIGMKQGLPGETVSSAMVDREGSLWMGLWGAGLVRILGYRSVENWTSSSGLRSSTVSSIAQDARGRIWAGTDAGMARLDPGAAEWRSAGLHPGLRGSKIRALAVSGSGVVWAGAFPGGVMQVDPATLTARRIGSESGLTAERVNGLLIDGTDRLWVASLEGLFRSSPLSGPLRFERMKVPGAPATEAYFRMTRGHGGTVWISSSGGLLRYHDGQWRRLGVEDGLLSSGLTHVTETPDGVVWVAYRDPLGVSSLTFSSPGARPEVKHYHENLSSKMILLLRSDAKGRVWIGGDDGLDVVSSHGWTRFAQSNGLAGNSCAVDSFLSAADGSVWAGTARGLTHILDPEHALHPQTVELRADLSWVRIGNRGVDVSQLEAHRSVEASYRQGAFEAGLAALTFRDRNRVHFRYRLLGSHENWVETTEREVRYPQLAPGDYTFEATAFVPSVYGETQPLRVGFRILPPWWATWWFRLFSMMIVAAGVAAVWRWRSGLLQIQKDELESAVAERTRELEVERAHAAEEKEKADEANRCKSEFLAKMSHEIRTPMHGVVGMTDVLLLGEMKPDQREMLNVVKGCATSLMTLLNDILDLSKIEAGKFVLRHVSFDPHHVAQTVVDLMRTPAENKGLALTLNGPGIGASMVKGDPERIHQILVNLVSNAIKFTHSGAVVVNLSCRAGSEPQRGLSLEVVDTGEGIPEERIDSLFAPFVQLHDVGRHVQEGTGLGLAISKGLTDAMGGTIHVISAVGEGSTFRVHLPLEVTVTGDLSGVSKPTSENGSAASAGSCYALVVEDNQVNQRIVASMLRALGHRSRVVSNGKEALSAVEEERFDLVLMDCQMPEMNGLEATSIIRNSHSSEQLPIVALSANVFASDREACLDAGMDDFLFKPLHIEELDQCVRRVLNRNGRALRPVSDSQDFHDSPSLPR